MQEQDEYDPMCTKRQRLRVLARAKKGDRHAQDLCAMYVFKKHQGRCRRHLNSSDPAIDMEDLMATFWQGVAAALPGLDGRGDDFYHAGQRGMWAASSHCRQIEKQMSRRTYLKPYDEDGGARTVEDFADPHEPDAMDVLAEQLDAENQALEMVQADLKPRSRQALELILNDDELDPTELGFNKALAEKMGLSPQRASQVTTELRQELMGQL